MATSPTSVLLVHYMFLLCGFMLLLESTMAFRPPMLSEELGCSPTLSMLLGRESFYFDPLGLATDSTFPRLREAELKHGRICMLANVQLIVTPLLMRLLEQQKQLEKFEFPTTTTIVLPSDSIVQNLLVLSSQPPVDYLNMFVTCGFLEFFVFVQRDASDMPGDYGIGYFGVRNKGLHERSLIVELENGRLAMLALIGQLIAELVSGMSWIAQWEQIIQQVTQATDKYLQVQ
jgi:light-harvesting complex I chlorophyll a/b binding protein 1